jgi:hypothetical protein
MRRIIQANIERLKVLLKTETDPTKRAMEARLLAEEELKKNTCLLTTRKKARLINLAVVGPFAPMCRLYVDSLFRRSIHPISFAFADREHQRVAAALVHHTDLKVVIGWRH